MSKYDYLHALYQELIPLDSKERNKIMREVEDTFRDAEESGNFDLDITQILDPPKEYAKRFLPVTEAKQVTSDNISLDSLKSTEPLITRAPNLIDSLELTSDLPGRAQENDDDEVTKEINDTLTHYSTSPKPIKKIYTSPQPITNSQIVNHPLKIVLITFLMLLFNAILIIGPFIAIWSTIIALVASGFAIGISGLAVIISGLLGFPLNFISLPIIMLNHHTLLFCFGFILTGIGGLLTIGMIYTLRFFAYITFKYFSWNLSVIRGY